MEVCRICLAADRKMFVLDTKHKQLYESVTGITVQPVDRLPKHICWECKHFMSKYLSFKTKAMTSHCILTEILTTHKTFTTLEKHQPKLTLTCTGIWYSNLDGVDHEELDDDKDVTEIKNEADLIWKEEINFTSYDNGEINVISDNTPVDNINEEANFTTKEARRETFDIVTNIEITKESYGNVSNIEITEEIVRKENEIEIKERTVKNLHNIEFPEHSVKNDTDIETTEKTVENLNNNEILDIVPGDYTDDDKNEFCVSNGSDEISSKSIKNISSEPIDETSTSKRKLELDKTLQTVTRLSKEKQIPKMKIKVENCFKEFLDIDTFNRHVEKYFKRHKDISTITSSAVGQVLETHNDTPAAGPHCERCDLRLCAICEFDDHVTCSTNLADKRTTKITPRLTEPMVVNEIQFAKSPRVELRKHYAPPGYPPLLGAPLKKPKADSLKVKNSSKTSNKAVYSDANNAELSKRTKHLEEVKEKANCTETVVGDKNNSLIEYCKDKFICDECGQQFIKKDNIILHMKRKHVNDIYIRFQKYAYSSVTKDRLEKHSNLNCDKKKYFCDECNRFISKNILKRHKQRCGKKNNVSNTHSALEPYLCKKCGMHVSKHDFIRHMRTHTGEKPYVCTVCSKLSQSSNLNTHMRTHTGEKPYSCAECKKQFSVLCSLKYHMSTHTGEKPYSCTVCNKHFRLSSDLKKHMKIHTGEKPYVCTVCNKQFSQRGHLDEHIRIHTGEKPYSCTVCNKHFRLSSVLKKHMRIHTGEKPYVCTVCSKQFSESSKLNIHMRTHTGEKPYSCTVCKKQFSQSGSLNIHMRIHTGGKPYSCTVCNKQFKSGDLKYHMRTHTGEKPYLCTVCSKQFITSGNLNKHMRTHTGEKPFSCTVCKKQFSESSKLNMHMRTHTGEKPYSCKVCNKQFSKSSHLNRHMRTHTGEKPYSCTVCKKQFVTSDYLNTHMRTHTGEKPYSCSVCKRRFSDNSNLWRHSKTCQ